MSSWRHAAANVPPFLPLAAPCKPQSQRIAFDSCQSLKLTCSIMQVSARPLTLNLLFHFNINGSRMLLAEAAVLMNKCAVWFQSFSPSTYTHLLDVSVESSIQHLPNTPGPYVLSPISWVAAIQEKHRDSTTLEFHTTLGVHAVRTASTSTCTLLSCSQRERKSRTSWLFVGVT